MLKGTTEGGSGKAGTPEEFKPTPGPITKEFAMGPPPKGPPPPGTPKRIVSPLPPPYLFTSGGELTGGLDLGSGSQYPCPRPPALVS